MYVIELGLHDITRTRRPIAAGTQAGDALCAQRIDITARAASSRALRQSPSHHTAARQHTRMATMAKVLGLLIFALRPPSSPPPPPREYSHLANALRSNRPERRQAHLHAIDASPFSRLEQLDANRTPSPYQEANGLVLDRLKVESVVEMIITTSPNLSWYMLGDRTVSRLMWRSGTATVHQPFRRRRRVAAVSSLPSRSVTSAILQSADVVHETPIFADFSSTGATSVKSYFARPSFSEQM